MDQNQGSHSPARLAHSYTPSTSLSLTQPALFPLPPSYSILNPSLPPSLPPSPPPGFLYLRARVALEILQRHSLQAPHPCLALTSSSSRSPLL